MSLNLPSSRDEIANRMKSDVKSKNPTANPFLRVGFLPGIIFAISGRIFDLVASIKILVKNLFWHTSSIEYLTIWASYFGITRNPAKSASGNITFEAELGITVPIDTELQNTDGKTYKVLEAATSENQMLTLSIEQSSGVATAESTLANKLAIGNSITIAGANEDEYNGTFQITNVLSDTEFQFDVDPDADSPATGTITGESNIIELYVEAVDVGSDTNMESGDSLTFLTPISGINDIGFVQFSGITGGEDEEEVEDFRERFLFRVQNPVALFNNNAIENEVKKTTGVTRVWVNGVDITAGSIAITEITQSGGIAICETSAAHTIADGQRISITGANEDEYNVSSSRCLVLDSTHFCFLVDPDADSPATGSSTVSFSIVEEGQIKIYAVKDNSSSLLLNASEISEIEDRLEAIKPANVSMLDVFVQNPEIEEVDFAFSAISPDSDTMRTAIENNLEAFFQEEVTLHADVLQTSYLTAIRTTVDPTNGQKLDSFTLSTPTTNKTGERGKLYTLGEISFA